MTNVSRDDNLLSRRQMLFGAGLLGMGGALCACGSISAWALLARRSAPDSPTIRIVTPEPTAMPELTIISREAWGALPPNHQARSENGFYNTTNPGGWRVYDDDLQTVYSTVVLHHSVIYRRDDLSTLRDIQTLHRNDRGWADVAYHFFIGKDGTLYAGRDLSVRGAHVGGYNTGSLGICLLGDFTVADPTPAQLTTTEAALRWATARLQLTHLATHRAFNTETECPGDKLAVHLPRLAQAANLSVGTEGYVPPDESASLCPCCGDGDCAS